MPLPLDRARAFLSVKRVAVIGVSRDPKDFSRVVFRALLERGYDAVPVSPALGEAEGRRAFAAVSAVDPPPEAALILVPAALAAEVTRDALGAGVRRLWFHRGAGAGSATPAALGLCEAAGVEPVTDLCPFMALEGAGLPHRVHGFFRTRLGRRAAARA